jgi:hypothetical protein
VEKLPSGTIHHLRAKFDASLQWGTRDISQGYELTEAEKVVEYLGVSS